MRKKVLLTYSLKSEDVTQQIPTYLDKLNGVTFSTRRLIYGFQPELYLTVVYVGDEDHSEVDKHWVNDSNTFILPYNSYNEARSEYPHQKLGYNEFLREEAKKKAFQIQDNLEELLS